MNEKENIVTIVKGWDGGTKKILISCKLSPLSHAQMHNMQTAKPHAEHDCKYKRLPENRIFLDLCWNKALSLFQRELVLIRIIIHNCTSSTHSLFLTWRFPELESRRRLQAYAQTSFKMRLLESSKSILQARSTKAPRKSAERRYTRHSGDHLTRCVMDNLSSTILDGSSAGFEKLGTRSIQTFRSFESSM